MDDHIQQLILILREFADGAKHGAIYSEHVKFRAYTCRLLTALDDVSDSLWDPRLLETLLDTAQSVRSVSQAQGASLRDQNGPEVRQLGELSRYMVMDCINRLSERGAGRNESEGDYILSLVVRAGMQLRDLASAALTKDQWEKDTMIVWEYLVPLCTPCWQVQAQLSAMLCLLLGTIRDGVQFLPASEDMLCSKLETLKLLVTEFTVIAEYEVWYTCSSGIPCWCLSTDTSSTM